MDTIQGFFTDDHRDCDHRLADMETVVASGDWPASAEAYGPFHHDIERHFQREETMLFPAIEEVSGSPQGPTEVMRREHDQMRALMEGLEQALQRQERDEALGVIETLMTMIQLHNVKEEQILYPMADRFLQPRREALMERVRNLEP